MTAPVLTRSNTHPEFSTFFPPPRPEETVTEFVDLGSPIRTRSKSFTAARTADTPRSRNLAVASAGTSKERMLELKGSLAVELEEAIQWRAKACDSKEPEVGGNKLNHRWGSNGKGKAAKHGVVKLVPPVPPRTMSRKHVSASRSLSVDECKVVTFAEQQSPTTSQSEGTVRGKVFSSRQQELPVADYLPSTSRPLDKSCGKKSVSCLIMYCFLDIFGSLINMNTYRDD